MEIRMNGLYLSHSQISREFCIERMQQSICWVRPFVEIECCHLPRCMDAGIGPARHDDGCSHPTDLMKGVFELALYRPGIRLPLAAGKPGAVVG